MHFEILQAQEDFISLKGEVYETPIFRIGVISYNTTTKKYSVAVEIYEGDDIIAVEPIPNIFYSNVPPRTPKINTDVLSVDPWTGAVLVNP